MRNIRLLHFDTIDSTNRWARKQLHLFDLEQLSCVTATTQTAGRGRQGKRWLSPPGNLYASLVFGEPLNFPYLSNLGQLLSLSCAKMLASSNFAPKIKWPNDVLLEGKKVAGVLCETVPLPTCTAVILGIGINVNMGEKLLSEIDQPATSLQVVSGHPWNTSELLEQLLPLFLTDLELLERQGFAPLRSSYERFFLHKGEMLSVSGVQGVCEGVNERGELLLRTASGELRSLASGAVLL